MKGKGSVAALCLLAAVGMMALYGVVVSLRGEAEPITLTIWHVYGSDTRSPFSNAVGEFNRTRGAELGITVRVASILGADTIDAPLVSAAHGEPGAPPTPDLFTAYPRAALLVGPSRLLDWGACLRPDELSAYMPDFLADGMIGGRQLGLPIAKSTTSLFINQTAFDRELTGGHDLATWEGLYAAGREYSRATGNAMIHFNDYYTYFLALTDAAGGMLIMEPTSDDAEALPRARLALDSPAFVRAFMDLALATAVGAVDLSERYGSELWMTEEIIASIGSSAGLLYLRDFVARPDGSREEIETRALKFPVMRGTDPAVVSRGSSLWAFRSRDERRNRAAAEFARWITAGEQNIKFATSAGYMPVTISAFETLSRDMDALITKERDRRLYRSFLELRSSGTKFVSLPLYSNISEIQTRFETAMRNALLVAKSAMDGRSPDDPASAAIAAQEAYRALLRNTEDIR